MSFTVEEQKASAIMPGRTQKPMGFSVSRLSDEVEPSGKQNKGVKPSSYQNSGSLSNKTKEKSMKLGRGRNTDIVTEGTSQKSISEKHSKDGSSLT